MTPPHSHGEHIARMKEAGKLPIFIPMKERLYIRFRSWLQGYAWKPYCSHWFLFARYCKECDAFYCHKCRTKFPREYTSTRAPQGEVVQFNHNHPKHWR